ncbi:hypothetical protein GTU79_16775 [Sodalis ligni]|nr:hypothetical protein GTU79_16775 [Sodalis ligni]
MEVSRLAITKRVKPIHFISTIATGLSSTEINPIMNMKMRLLFANLTQRIEESRAMQQANGQPKFYSGK